LSEAADVSSDSFHEVTIESVRATETTATYRVHGSFRGRMRKVGPSSSSNGALVAFEGGWSLLLTLAK
jgi:hypothetical protein